MLRQGTILSVGSDPGLCLFLSFPHPRPRHCIFLVQYFCTKKSENVRTSHALYWLCPWKATACSLADHYFLLPSLPRLCTGRGADACPPAGGVCGLTLLYTHTLRHLPRFDDRMAPDGAAALVAVLWEPGCNSSCKWEWTRAWIRGNPFWELLHHFLWEELANSKTAIEGSPALAKEASEVTGLWGKWREKGISDQIWETHKF